MTELVGKEVTSHKQLPLRLYQVSRSSGRRDMGHGVRREGRRGRRRLVWGGGGGGGVGD